MSTRQEFLCSLSSALITQAVTYPVNKVIYRQILDNVPASVSIKHIRNEGFYYLYRGVMPPLVHRVLQNTTLFTVFSGVKTNLKKYNLGVYEEQFIASFIAGCLRTMFVPFERIQVLLVHNKFHNKYKNMFDVFKTLGPEYGLREYYRGIGIMYFRNIVTSIFFMLAKGEADKRIKKVSMKETAVNFVEGSALGLLMDAIVYPTKVVKIKVLMKVGTKYEPYRDVIVRIYKKNNGGLKNFYRGIWTDTVRACFHWGITISVYEQLKHIVK